jgi:hypothetical protein
MAASGKVATHEAGENMTVEEIFCDTSSSEAAAADADERAKQGLVSSLSPTSTVL